MAGIIDNAITRLQQIALECAPVKSAPQQPPESAAVLPVSVAHIVSGNGEVQSRGEVQMILNIGVDIHVNMQTLKSAYDQMNTIIPAYLKRLAGDPTLNSSVATIVYPVTFEIVATQWNTTPTLMAGFTVPIKFREDTIE